MFSRNVSALAVALWCAGAGLLALPGPAVAQESAAPATRPFRQIFGSAPIRSPNQNLEINLSLTTAYDQNVLADAVTEADQRFAQSGTMSSLVSTVEYSRRFRNVDIGIDGGTGIQYYWQEISPMGRDHHVNAHMGVRAGARGRFDFAQSVAYATYYTLAGLPGAGLPPVGTTPIPAEELFGPSADFGVAARGAAEYQSSAAFSRDIGRRSSLAASYSFRHFGAADEPVALHRTGLSYRAGIGREAAVRIGHSYAYSEGSVAAAPMSVHTIDAGLDYRKYLSRRRGTLLTFSTGSSVLDDAGQREFRLLGNVRLSQRIGRSWGTAFIYDRGVQYLPVIGDLFTSDTVSAALGGYINARLDTAFSANYSSGLVGADHHGQLKTWSVSGRAQYGLSRRLALSAHYLYYLYDFSGDVTLPEGLPTGVTRHAIRVGLNVWLPVIR